VNIKKALIYGIVAGLLAAFANIIFNYIYTELTLVDFSVVINIKTILAASMITCLFGAFAIVFFEGIWPKGGLIAINIIVVIVAFASLYMPLTVQLPLDGQSPALFYGLALPMHFITPLILLGVHAIFRNQ